MNKINNLIKALNDLGIKTELDTNAEWFSTIDGFIHYGIEIYTDMNYGEDCWSFIFTPNGEYITDIHKAPTERR